MKILGLQKLTLLDYPGRLAAILFLGGCNYRCPFCQNSSLVLTPDLLPEISHDELIRFLKKRSGILEGICITGGEPTLHADLPDLIREIRACGYPVKLDTNGTNPDLLSSLIDEGLLDYVAMDIKAGRENYQNVCGLTEDAAARTLLEKVSRSVRLLLQNSVDYEFRTTVVRGLHTETDFLDIAQWLSGCRRYFLQSFRDCDEILLQGHSFSEFSAEEMQHFLKIVQTKIPQASLRGI